MSTTDTGATSASDTTQQLFILSRVRAGNGVASVVTVDVVMDESFEINSTVTDHPVEEGANMSDHSRPEPIVITANCIVSETPISASDTTRALNGAASTSTNGIQSVPGYAKRVFDQPVAETFCANQDASL